MNDFKIVILGYYIHFFDSVAFIGFRCLISSTPCNFQMLCISNYACPNWLNKVFVLFKAHPCTLWDEPHPHARIPMMPNKISEAKRTNKGHLTYSICCASAWSSSHSNFAFFFILSRALFSFCFCLACGLLKIWVFIAWWFYCLSSPTWIEGWPNLPTSMWNPYLLFKCWWSSHLAA